MNRLVFGIFASLVGALYSSLIWLGFIFVMLPYFIALDKNHKNAGIIGLVTGFFRLDIVGMGYMYNMGLYRY